MKKIAFLATAAVLALSACSQTSAPQSHNHHNHHNHSVATHTASSLSDQVFTCQNGMTATVKHNVGEDKIRLHVDTIESSTILSLAPSGSGERYINAHGFYNKATEFHMKGKEAAFSFQDPYGNQVQTACYSK